MHVYIYTEASEFIISPPVNPGFKSCIFQRSAVFKLCVITVAAGFTAPLLVRQALYRSVPVRMQIDLIPLQVSIGVLKYSSLSHQPNNKESESRVCTQRYWEEWVEPLLLHWLPVRVRIQFFTVHFWQPSYINKLLVWASALDPQQVLCYIIKIMIVIKMSTQHHFKLC